MSSDDKIIHVSVDTPTQEELEMVRDLMEGALEDYAGSGKIVVTDQRMDLHELPALDNYMDELANRIAERMGQNE